MKSEFMPTTVVGKLVHLIEECSEVQKETCKILRFGLNSVHPLDAGNVTNRDRLLSEIKDLKTSIEIVIREILL